MYLLIALYSYTLTLIAAVAPIAAKLTFVFRYN